MATSEAMEERKPLQQTYEAAYQGVVSRQTFLVTGQPRTAESSAPLVAPPGAPITGMWVEDRYCGITTWLVTLLAGFPCAYFCPCDRRTVWLADNVKYNEKGAVVDDYVCLNPCPPGPCHPDP